VNVHSVDWKDAASALENVALGTFLTRFFWGVVGQTVGVNYIADVGRDLGRLVGWKNVAVFALLALDWRTVFEAVGEQQSGEDTFRLVVGENRVPIVAFQADEGVRVLKSFAMQVLGQAGVADQAIPPLASQTLVFLEIHVQAVGFFDLIVHLYLWFVCGSIQKRGVLGLIGFEHTQIVFELVAWVAGSASSIFTVEGGALRVDLRASQCFGLIVVPAIAFEAAWGVGFDLAIGILRMDDDTGTVIFGVSGKAGIASCAYPWWTIVLLAVLVDALAVSIFACVHPGNALRAPTRGNVEVQTVTVVIYLLDAVHQGLRTVLQGRHQQDLVEIGVAFCAKALGVCSQAGVKDVRRDEYAAERSNSAVDVVGQLIARVAWGAGSRIGLVGLAEGWHRDAVELEVEIVPFGTDLANAELVLLAVDISRLRDALSKLSEHERRQAGQAAAFGVKNLAVFVDAGAVLHDSIRTALGARVGVGVDLLAEGRQLLTSAFLICEKPWDAAGAEGVVAGTDHITVADTGDEEALVARGESVLIHAGSAPSRDVGGNAVGGQRNADLALPVEVVEGLAEGAQTRPVVEWKAIGVLIGTETVVL
jgi:pyrimidine operon attenuation protein/uracil phosphoribosyltransferase